MSRRIAGWLLCSAMIMAQPAHGQTVAPLSVAQTIALNKRCARQIAAVNRYSPGDAVSLSTPGMLHDLATTTEGSVINAAKLSEMTTAIKQARAAGENEAMITLFDAAACVLKGRLDLASKPPKPGEFDPYSATEYDFQKRALTVDFKRAGESLHQAKATAGMSTSGFSCSSAREAMGGFASVTSRLQGLEKLTGFRAEDVPMLNKMGVEAGTGLNSARQLAEFSCNRTDGDNQPIR